MANGPIDLLPAPDVTPDPAPAPRRARDERATCEFCECVLSPAGDVMAFSDKAKKLRDQGLAIEKLEKANREQETALGELRAEIAKLSTGRDRKGFKL